MDNEKTLGRPNEPLDPKLVKLVIAELKAMHRKRYGDKMVYDPTSERNIYVCKRTTYSLEDVFGDLEFTLNHIHLEK